MPRHIGELKERLQELYEAQQHQEVAELIQMAAQEVKMLPEAFQRGFSTVFGGHGGPTEWFHVLAAVCGAPQSEEMEAIC